MEMGGLKKACRFLVFSEQNLNIQRPEDRCLPRKNGSHCILSWSRKVAINWEGRVRPGSQFAGMNMSSIWDVLSLNCLWMTSWRCEMLRTTGVPRSSV